MTHKELKERIDRMYSRNFEEMSPSGMAKLTDGFCEELIRYILAERCEGFQLKAFRNIKEKYDKWKGENDMMWNFQISGSKKLFPKHFEQMEFDLECGRRITYEQVEDDGAALNCAIEADEDAGTLVINTNEKDKPAGSDQSELQARIKELEAENAELLAAQQETVEDIEWHDKVRLDLVLRLLEKDGADTKKYGNKTKVAQVMHAITGLPLTTCKNYCTNRDLSLTHHEEEILKLNAILQALGMEIRL